jgi:hypothetical protein
MGQNFTRNKMKLSDWFRRGVKAIQQSHQKTLLTGFRLWRQYWRQFWGYIFGGAYFPKKWDLLPPFQPLFKFFQGHMLSYEVKMSESCFVWAAPSLSLARTYLIIALFS